MLDVLLRGAREGHTHRSKRWRRGSIASRLAAPRAAGKEKPRQPVES